MAFGGKQAEKESMGFSQPLETAIVGCLVACLGAFAVYSARRRAVDSTEDRIRVAAAASKSPLSLLPRPWSEWMLEWFGVAAGSIFVVAGCALVAFSAFEFVAGSH
jgi:hypothetical protein